MEPTEITRSLTPELIRQLLNHHARAEMSSDYVRLMEIYCVVKAGGTAVQIEVARRVEQSERAALEATMAALADQADQVSRVQALRYEIQEVERSCGSRVAYLQNINPQEEAHVQSCIPFIDAYFASLGKAHD